MARTHEPQTEIAWTYSYRAQPAYSPLVGDYAYVEYGYNVARVEMTPQVANPPYSRFEIVRSVHAGDTCHAF